MTCPLHGRRFDLRPGSRSTARVRRRPRGPRRRRARSGCGLPETRTTCPYCGVGCGLVAEVRDGRLAAVRGDTRPPGQPRRDVPQADAAARGRARARPRDHADAAREPRRALADRELADGDQRCRQTPRRACTAGRDRVLHLRPAADRGLLRGQQAREGLPRHQQRRLELAPVHVERGRGLHGRTRLGWPAALVRRHRTGRVPVPASAPTPPPATRSCGTGSAATARS